MVAKTLARAEDRLGINRIGLWLFIVSDGFFFALLIAMRFYLLGIQRPPELNQLLGFAISIILLLSSLTAYRCETAASLGDQRRFTRNILLTIGFGTLFLVGVGIEWFEAFHFFPPPAGFGMMFFTLTGFHAFHVVTGLLALLAILWASRHRRFTPENHWAVEGVIKYWHFVDVAWVFIFPTLYLVS